MSTTYSIKIKDNGSTIVNIYGQFDGGLDSVGKLLYNQFYKTKIVNGFNPARHKAPEYANGIECFAAQVVAFLKKDIGNIYLMSKKQTDSCEYNYTFYIAKYGKHSPITKKELSDIFNINDKRKGTMDILSVKITDYNKRILYDDYFFRFFHYINWEMGETPFKDN